MNSENIGDGTIACQQQLYKTPLKTAAAHIFAEGISYEKSPRVLIDNIRVRNQYRFQLVHDRGVIYIVFRNILT